MDAINKVMPSLSLIIGAVGGIFAAYWIVTTYLQYRKLQHIRGPWIASISPVWMFYYTVRGTLYLAVEDALKKYGGCNFSLRRLYLICSL